MYSTVYAPIQRTVATRTRLRRPTGGQQYRRFLPPPILVALTDRAFVEHPNRNGAPRSHHQPAQHPIFSGSKGGSVLHRRGPRRRRLRPFLRQQSAVAIRGPRRSGRHRTKLSSQPRCVLGSARPRRNRRVLQYWASPATALLGAGLCRGNPEYPAPSPRIRTRRHMDRGIPGGIQGVGIERDSPPPRIDDALFTRAPGIPETKGDRKRALPEGPGALQPLRDHLTDPLLLHLTGTPKNQQTVTKAGGDHARK